MKTVLFGLDGATYTVLDHLIAEGVMPNLAALCSDGCRATLLSTPHPLTPQAWTTLATGRSAGHHGIHDFIRREANPRGVFWRVNDSRDIHCETIWEYASRHGRRVTVLNYYGLAPSRPINGHSIPAFVTGRHLRRSSYPPDLFDRLRTVDGFDPQLLGLDADREFEALYDLEPHRWGEWLRHHIERERAWFGVLEHLMTREPSDLTAIVFEGVDRIQHLAFRFLDPALIPPDPTPWEAEAIGLCRAYFRQIDDFLGRTVARLGPWGRLFIVSDHGFAASHEIVYINKWLHDQGLLRWRGTIAEDAQDAITAARPTDLANAIDLPHTKAYALTPSCIGLYIAAPPDEYESFREDLIRRLEQIEGPDGGRVVTGIIRREEAFSGPYVERIPDLTLRLRDSGCLSVLNGRAAVVRRRVPVGAHHPHGVLLGTGPGLRAGAEVGLLNILDVAPLLLHSLGLEIPEEFEGTFPARLYEPTYLGSDPPRIRRTGGAVHGAAGEATSPPDRGAPADEAFEDEADEILVLERLRSLGYIE